MTDQCPPGHRRLLMLAAIGGFAATAPAWGQESDRTAGGEAPSSADADVPYVPTPQPVVDRMLELAEVGKDDLLYDLGSGDGRIPITAAQDYDARGVGIEIRQRLVHQSRDNAEEAGVAHMVEFRHRDVFESDFGDATAVTLYLLPSINVQLRPMLFDQLEPGTPVVSHNFAMGAWEPERTVKIDAQTTLYKWIVPAEVPDHLQEDG